MSSKKEVHQLLARAQAHGWERLGFSGGSHHRIRWPATGQVLTVPSSPSKASWLGNCESDIARISGPIRPKPGPGRPKTERGERGQPGPPRRRPDYQPPAPQPPAWKQALEAWGATHFTEVET